MVISQTNNYQRYLKERSLADVGRSRIQSLYYWYSVNRRLNTREHGRLFPNQMKGQLEAFPLRVFPSGLHFTRP